MTKSNQIKKIDSLLRISSLGSGSKGNSTLIQTDQITLMVDCGFGLKETVRRLDELSVHPEQIDAILVTHEHQDHISGVESLAAKFDLQVFMTAGTKRAWKSRGRITPVLVSSGNSFLVKNVEVQPVAVPHDAKEPVQYVISYLKHKVGILTDLGSLTRHIHEAYKDCQAILIEANHDVEMLQNGSYPSSLKKRVAGDWGHLNNMQTAVFLAQLQEQGHLNQVIIGHISEQNNRIDLVKEKLQAQLGSFDRVIFAQQGQSLDWIDI